MELFFILVILISVVSPLGLKAYHHVVPEIEYKIRTRRTLGQIKKNQLALATEQKAHEDALLTDRANHILELAEFDKSILAIEKPAYHNMVERRVIESTTAHMPTDRDYWLNEKHLLQKDFEHIHRLCEGSEVTETDIGLMNALVDRMDVVRSNLDRLEEEEEKANWKRLQEERHEEKLEKERRKAPQELFDFLEVVNDPDSSQIKQMKALKTFVGDDIGEIKDIYYSRYTVEQLLDAAEKKIERLHNIPDFDELMGAEALHRLTNADDPDKLMKLWGVNENFNKWVSYVD